MSTQVTGSATPTVWLLRASYWKRAVDRQHLQRAAVGQHAGRVRDEPVEAAAPPLPLLSSVS